MTKKSSREMSKDRAVKRVLILSAAYLMDEEGWDKERITDFFEGIVRWSDAIHDHLITINDVIALLNEKTGATLRW